MSFKDQAIAFIQKNLINRKTGNVVSTKVFPLLTSVFLGFFGIKSSGSNDESPASISDPTPPLPEPRPAPPKLRPPNTRPSGNHASSWYYWLFFGIALGAFGYACYYWYHQKSLHKKKHHSTPGKHVSRGPQPIRYRGFKNLSANHCFANALLICLIHLPDFKHKVFQATASKKSSNLVLKSLSCLFKAIDQTPEDLSTENIEACKEDFCSEITKSSPGIQVFYKNGGDSRSLFQIIHQNIPQNFDCFSFKEEKTTTCEGCLRKGRQIVPKKFTENPFILNIQEDLYFQNEFKNPSFLSQTELRTCKVCGPKTLHKKEITLSDLPEVLAIRIAHNGDFKNGDSETPNLQKRKSGPWLYLSLGRTDGGEQGYRFVGGVYNTNEGYNGVHSVAYIYKKEDESMIFLCYNDTNVRKVRFEDIKEFPKLMFYVKDSRDHVALDMTEERLLEESMDGSLEERSDFCWF